MGFETKIFQSARISVFSILTLSLWDLKLTIANNLNFKIDGILTLSLWDLKRFCCKTVFSGEPHFNFVPMGFETLNQDCLKKNMIPF